MPAAIVPPARRKTKATVRRRRQRVRILRLAACGFSPAEIARQPGVIYTATWIRSLLKREEARHKAQGRRAAC